MNLKMKAARVEKGYSQADLAKKVGVTRQTIILVEQKKFNPSLRLCLAICKELNKTLDALFWEDEE